MAKPSNNRGAAPTGMALLRSVLVGLLVAALVLTGAYFALPAQDAHDPARLYDYVYSGVKSESTAFTLSTMSDDGHLAFGSSEFFISKDKVAQCPQAVFGEQVCRRGPHVRGRGLRSESVAGHRGRRVRQRGAEQEGDAGRVAAVVLQEQRRPGQVRLEVLVDAVPAVRDNPNISDETKAYVRSRVEQLGVDAKTTAAAHHDTVLDAVNDVAGMLADDLSLRAQLPGVVEKAPLKSPVRAAGTSTGEPDWNALLAQADASGDEACTTNGYGIYDAYWEKNSGYDVERGQNFSEADDEYADFSCFLDVCREVGLEPLVVVLPVHGAWYDREGVPASERQAYYERIRRLCDKAGAAYADFSSCEYEKYFLCDTVHPGWRGWVRIERASTTSCTIATTPSSAAAPSARPRGSTRPAMRARRLSGVGEAAS